MALNPNILLGFTPQDNTQTFNIFNSALNQAQSRRIQQQEADQRAALFPTQQQQVEQQAALGALQLQDARNKSRVLDVATFSQQLKPQLEADIARGNFDRSKTILTRRLAELQRRQAAGENVDTTETAEALQLLEAGRAEDVLLGANTFIDLARSQGVITSQKTAAQREFDQNIARVKADPNLETSEGKAAAVALGIEARASTSAQERIAADPELTDAVAESQAEIEGKKAAATEGAKLEKQRKFKPEIAKSVKLAEAEAKERGETLTDLARMEASLPGVREAVDELVDLSEVATSTFAGRAFDAVVKESGFGSTKGANARAKLIAIVDNQVLPLLKETFGAAFTVQEGENLKASLVDPNASPEQKRQQLEAFLAQKERNIRTKQTQLGIGPQQPQQQTTQPIQIGRFQVEVIE